MKRFSNIDSKPLLFLSFLLSFLLICSLSTHAGNLKYQVPPKIIADIVDAPPTPSVDLSPDNQWMLILERPNLPSIAEISQPELRIAGIRINPRTNGPSRVRYLSFQVKRKKSGYLKMLGLPISVGLLIVRK